MYAGRSIESQYADGTDRQTDGQTDGRQIVTLCFSLDAARVKSECKSEVVLICISYVCPILTTKYHIL